MGDESRALVGEIMTSVAQMRGAAGFVLDGAVRDTDALSKSSFPCFARAGIHLGPYKHGPGEINVPVNIGGMMVKPGDIVVGDADGVVAFSQDIAPILLEVTRAQSDREAEILRQIAEGHYIGAYATSVSS